MGARLAVDLGCTTLVAATAEEGGESAPRLLEFADEDGPRGTLVASLTWSPGGFARVGIDADRALDGDPHRGVRGPLAHLESGAATLELAAGPVPVVALTAELLARAMRVATRELGQPPADAVLTVPAAWPLDGRRARALRAAASLAGLPPLSCVASAVAAAELVRDEASELVLVCDVGGRTAQLAVVDLRDGPGRLLATTELVVGADLFDELIYLEVLRELAEHVPDAARRLEDLHVQAGAAGDVDAAAWVACQADLARAVRHCREVLTTSATQRLAIGPPVSRAFDLEQQRVRALLTTDHLILAGAAREQLTQADPAGGQQGAGRAEHVRVMLIGGGALTPGLREALEAELDLPVAALDDPATIVARGALLALPRPAGAAPPAQVRTSAGGRRPAASRQVVRTVLEDVVAATTSAGDVVAVVRHDSHHRAVRIDPGGRVSAAHSVEVGEIGALTATESSIVVAGPLGAAVFSADLRPLQTIERPLLVAAHGASVWLVSAGSEQTPILDLVTLAIEGRDARIAGSERLGLAAPLQPGRLPRRAARPAPPRAHCIGTDAALQFAVPVRGRGAGFAQCVGAAGPAGLGDVQTRGGPDWVTGLAPAAGGAVIQALAGAGGTRLSQEGAQLASWPAGVRVRLAADDGHAAWVVAARQARWEALRIDRDAVASIRSGDGVVEYLRADGDGVWLVCESGGERRLVRVGAGGELQRLAALGAPLEPVGRSGEEILALAGPRGAARTLVAFSLG